MHLYVDKTGFIKELMESSRPVQIYAKPRRMGKTMNLTMIRRYVNVPSAFPLL